MLSRLRATLELNRSIPIVWLFQSQSIVALAARLADSSSFEDISALPPLSAAVSSRADAETTQTPLSFQQVGHRRCLCCLQVSSRTEPAANPLWHALLTLSLLQCVQEQFYQLWERAPDSSAYNSGFAAMLRGPVDVAALQIAARSLFKRQQVRRKAHAESSCRSVLK